MICFTVSVLLDVDSLLTNIEVYKELSTNTSFNSLGGSDQPLIET